MAHVPADPSLPAVALEIVSPERLEDEFSGAVVSRPWQGRLGDGEEFTVVWGRKGDLLFCYGERASFLLSPGGDRLDCAPVNPGSIAWLRVLLTRVLPNVSIANGYEALHASAVATDRGTVAIVAASGSGKSTLALELIKRGRPLFADDTLVLGRGAGAVQAYPSTPFVNLPTSAGDPPAAGTDLGTLGGERWLAVAGAAVDASPVAAVVLLERGPGKPLGAWPLRESPLLLAPFMLGLPDHRGREVARFTLYSDLVRDARLLRLSADPGHLPEDLAETLERAILRGSPVAARGAA
jgi:hypothetical protein